MHWGGVNMVRSLVKLNFRHCDGLQLPVFTIMDLSHRQLKIINQSERRMLINVTSYLGSCPRKVPSPNPRWFYSKITVKRSSDECVYFYWQLWHCEVQNLQQLTTDSVIGKNEFNRIVLKASALHFIIFFLQYWKETILGRNIFRRFCNDLCSAIFNL